ncbi:MAG TPA: type VI secretion system protein TssA [Tepidisphaeraceae bacterium]
MQDVSADGPCGQNLEYDPEYLELMRAAQGTPERQMGATVTPAEEPNWRDVRDRCVKLFGRTKDLTVATKLCEALLRLEGLGGLRTGLGLVGGLVGQRWPEVHPRLDPEDGNDPTARMTILANLTDQGQFISKIRAVPLTNSMAGKFSLREIGWSRGVGAPPEGVAAPKSEVVEAAFRDTPVDELRATLQDAEQAIAVVQAMDIKLTSLVGAGQGISFEPILKTLTEVAAEVRKHLPAGERGANDASGAGGNGKVGGGGAAASAPAAGAGRIVAGEIQSLDDVRAAIHRICKYLEQAEPSSPIPLLLRRAERLVGKNFLEILKDVSPDGVKQAESLAGIVEPQS